MGDMKQHQPPLTIEEQIENPKSIGFFWCVNMYQANTEK